MLKTVRRGVLLSAVIALSLHLGSCKDDPTAPATPGSVTSLADSAEEVELSEETTLDSATAAFYALTGSMPPDTTAQASLRTTAMPSASAIATASFSTAAVSSDPLILTFEDLEQGQHPMYHHNPYHGLTFRAFFNGATIYHWDETWYGRPHSGVHFLFNGFGADAEPVTLASPARSVGLWVGEPHDQPKAFWIEGFAGSTKIGESEHITLSRDQRYLAVEFSQAVDRLVFRRTQGWWVADDFCLSATPEACAPTAQPQSITFAPLQGKTFGDADFDVSATASSGLVVSFTATGKCTVAGITVHLTGAGTCTVTAHQAGNTSYQPAEDVARSFDIAKAAATITLSALAHTYDGSPKNAAAATDPAGLSGVALIYDGSPTPPTNAGSYAVRATLTNDDYTAGPTDGTLVIAKAPATITLTDPAPVYDGSAKQAGVSTSPAGLTGVSLTYALDGSPVASPVNAGSYQVQGTLANDNHEAPSVSGTLTIGQATPAIQWASPASITVGTPLGATQLNATATGIGGAGLTGSFVYTPAGGTVLGAAPAHQLSVAFSPSDANYTGVGKSVPMAVLYQFSGFFQPVDNPTVVNKVKAGRAIPVKFSLGGNQGLDILQAGSPTTSNFSCSAVTTEDLIEETVTASTSGLQYDAAADQYIYVWKTGTGFANSCRKLTVTLKDGTRHESLFHFIK